LSLDNTKKNVLFFNIANEQKVFHPLFKINLEQRNIVSHFLRFENLTPTWSTQKKVRDFESFSRRLQFSGDLKKIVFNEIIFIGEMLMNSFEVRRCLVEMQAVLGEDEKWYTKEDLLKIDRDHFPSDLGHFCSVAIIVKCLLLQKEG
jgi:hypothetical protein